MPPWWQMTPAQRARRRAGIVRMVRAGGPVSRAAARYGVTARTVYLACRAQGLVFGLEGDSGAFAVARRRRDAIVRAGSTGLGAAELARRFGVSRGAAAAACRGEGVVLPRSGTRSSVRLRARRAALRSRARGLAAGFRSRRSRRAARLLLTTDQTLESIARSCGISPQRVHHIWIAIQRSADARA